MTKEWVARPVMVLDSTDNFVVLGPEFTITHLRSFSIGDTVYSREFNSKMVLVK